MKNQILSLGTLALAAQLSSAAVITLDIDTASPSPAFNTSFSGTINDDFVYDEFDPTSTAPERNLTTSGEATANGYHSTGGGAAILRYTLVSGTYTASAGEVIVVDVWGRNSSVFNEARDDDFDVRLYNGDYVTAVASVVNQAIAPEVSNPNHFHRVEFTGFTGDFDRMEITARNSSGEGNNNFVLMETRLASIPEPSSTAVLGLAGLGLALRRRRA